MANNGPNRAGRYPDSGGGGDKRSRDPTAGHHQGETNKPERASRSSSSSGGGGGSGGSGGGGRRQQPDFNPLMRRAITKSRGTGLQPSETSPTYRFFTSFTRFRGICMAFYWPPLRGYSAKDVFFPRSLKIGHWPAGNWTDQCHPQNTYPSGLFTGFHGIGMVLNAFLWDGISLRAPSESFQVRSRFLIDRSATKHRLRFSSQGHQSA